MDGRDDEALALINEIRRAARLGRLATHPRLAAAAHAHAFDMADYRYFAHTDREGGGVFTRARRAGYFPPERGYMIAENIAYGNVCVEAIVQGWMDSPGHRQNILTPDFVDTGIAHAAGADGLIYWVQVFGVVRPSG